MNADTFKAQMEAMRQKEDKEHARVRPPLTEAELGYPAGFIAELEAMLQEEERKLVETKPHFIDSIRQVFQAQKEALLGEGHKKLDGAHANTKRAFIKRELWEAMRAHIEARTEPRPESEDQSQFLDRYRLYSTRRWEPSDQIYVMGSDLVGRYIATVLASTETIPPVRFLIHRINLWKEWQNCGRRMLLERATGPEIHDRIVGEFMSMKADPPLPGPLIRNLIVTVPPGSVVRALEPLIHRLDHRSTICLIHDGLGVAEAVIKAHFPDEHTRPAFILGHMTTSVGYSKGHFSVVELQQGRLYLSVLATKRVGHLITKHPPPERTTRYTNLLNLLMTIPDLNASSHPLPDLLRHKLPALAMLSIVQPIAAIFGVPWDELLKHHSTKQLMTDMLWEVCHVVSKMPECRNHEPAQLSSLSLHLQKKFVSQFHRRKGRPRKAESEVYRGWETDINYLTGYFLGRAAELKVPVPNLKAIYKMLQGKKHINAASMNNAIPFEDSKVTLVGDLAPLRRLT